MDLLFNFVTICNVFQLFLLDQVSLRFDFIW